MVEITVPMRNHVCEQAIDHAEHRKLEPQATRETSKGAAGVTGSGFVALVATLVLMPDLPVAGVAIIVGIDRFMSEARALTSTMSNAVACVVVSIWENACDRDVLKRELAQDDVDTELALEEEATIPIAPPATPVQPMQLH